MADLLSFICFLFARKRNLSEVLFCHREIRFSNTMMLNSASTSDSKFAVMKLLHEIRLLT